MSTKAKGGFYFILPSVIILGIFGVAVTVMNVGFSLTKWSALTSPVFNGLANYKRFFTDRIALVSLLNTFYYALLYVIPTAVISLLLALLLNSQSRAMSFFRALFYVPVITSYVIVIVVWQWIFEYVVHNPAPSMKAASSSVVGIACMNCIIRKIPKASLIKGIQEKKVFIHPSLLMMMNNGSILVWIGTTIMSITKIRKILRPLNSVL